MDPSNSQHQPLSAAAPPPGSWAPLHAPSAAAASSWAPPPAASPASAWAPPPPPPPPAQQAAFAPAQQYALAPAPQQQQQPFPEEPAALVTRVRVLAGLFLLISGFSALSGSIPSALYALFLYFGVIRGIPRGNVRALKWFSCCSLCGACLWAVAGLVALGVLGPLFACVCDPSCVAQRWEAQGPGSSSRGGSGGGGRALELAAAAALPLARSLLAPALPLAHSLLVPALQLSPPPPPPPLLQGWALPLPALQLDHGRSHPRHEGRRQQAQPPPLRHASALLLDGGHPHHRSHPAHAPPHPLLPQQQRPGPPGARAANSSSVDEAQAEAAMQCKLRGLYYFLALLLLGASAVHGLAWGWSRELARHPWMLALEALAKQRAEAWRQQQYQQQQQQQQQQYVATQGGGGSSGGAQPQLYVFTPGVGFSPVVNTAPPSFAPPPQQQQQQQQQQPQQPQQQPPTASPAFPSAASPTAAASTYVPPPYVPYRGEDGVFGDLGEVLQNNVVAPLRNAWMGMRQPGAGGGAYYVPVQTATGEGSLNGGAEGQQQQTHQQQQHQQYQQQQQTQQQQPPQPPQQRSHGY